MIVITIARTPSLKASSRFFPIAFMIEWRRESTTRQAVYKGGLSRSPT
jgi:hypothetical protein